MSIIIVRLVLFSRNEYLMKERCRHFLTRAVASVTAAVSVYGFIRVCILVPHMLLVVNGCCRTMLPYLHE